MASVPASERDRRVMFAMDFRDPVTGLGVTCLDVVADQLGPPIRPPSGRFVWLDFHAPAARNVKVTAKSPGGRFVDFEEIIAVPAHLPGTKPAALHFSRPLKPAGLYEPPPGMTAAAGWLIEDGTKAPVAGTEVSLAFRHAGTQTFISAYRAVTDAKGRFVAVANDLDDTRPDQAPPDAGRPGIDVGVLGWLVVKRAGETKFSGFLPLRVGRLERFAEPFLWSALSTDPP
jgi:hypothetical protein